MEPISSLSASPQVHQVLHSCCPVTTSKGRIPFLFFRHIPDFFHETTLQLKQKLLKLLVQESEKTDPSAESSLPILTIPPQLTQEIFTPHSSLFFIKAKEAVSFNFEIFQAQVVIKGWTSYLEHLCEEAHLRKASDLKHQRRKELIDSQQEKARIEKEEIQRQELRKSLLLYSTSVET